MDKVDQVIKKFHDTGLYTHVYVACGFLVEKAPIFEASILPDGRSIFDLSSLTKALVTTPLALREAFTRNLDPATLTLEEFCGSDLSGEYGAHSPKFTLAATLRHETGLPAWRNLYVECEGRRQTLSEAIRRCSDHNFRDKEPAERYSDLGFMLTGAFLERRHRKKLKELWQDFSKELGFWDFDKLSDDSTIGKSEAIPTAYCPLRMRILAGEVHDENAWAMGGFPGHTGLFGSGPAVCQLLHLLWASGSGRQIMEANFSMIKTQGDSLLGWRKGKDQSSLPFADGRGCGHMGFTGTAFWVDPKTLSYAVVLTNRVISGRVPVAIKEMRAQVFGALWNVIKSKE